MLDVELNQTNIIPENLRSGSVREHLKSLLDVIEETLRFIKGSMVRFKLGMLRIYRDVCILTNAALEKWFTRQSEMADLKKESDQASKNLDRCLIANIYALAAGSQINESNALYGEAELCSSRPFQ